jgi:uncharacterized membrane protein
MIEYLKALPTIQKGILLALGTALVSGVANFVNKWGVTAVGEPFVYTAMKNLVTAILLLGVLFAFKNIKQLKKLTKQEWLKLTVIGLIGGSIPFLLFFLVLKNFYSDQVYNLKTIHQVPPYFCFALILCILPPFRLSFPLLILGVHNIKY